MFKSSLGYMRRHKSAVVVHTWNPNVQEAKVRTSGSEASLGYINSYLNKKNNDNNNVLDDGSAKLSGSLSLLG